MGRLTEAAASARQVFDAASQHYADSLERVGSGRSAGTSEEALPDWGAGPQRGQEPPPLKLGKVGVRPAYLSALGRGSSCCGIGTGPESSRVCF